MTNSIELINSIISAIEIAVKHLSLLMLVTNKLDPHLVPEISPSLAN
jgi:hypothetical protein